MSETSSNVDAASRTASTPPSSAAPTAGLWARLAIPLLAVIVALAFVALATLR